MTAGFELMAVALAGIVISSGVQQRRSMIVQPVCPNCPDYRSNIGIGDRLRAQST
jgi:hypothetical protein